MSFQACLDNIQKKTAKSPEQLTKLAIQKGLLDKGGKVKADVKAREIELRLKEEFQLGHGHAMAIFAYFKEMRK
jgi:hypothetical protein